MDKREQLFRTFHDSVSYFFNQRSRHQTREQEMAAAQPVFEAAKMLEAVELDRAEADYVANEVRSVRALFVPEV